MWKYGISALISGVMAAATSLGAVLSNGGGITLDGVLTETALATTLIAFILYGLIDFWGRNFSGILCSRILSLP